MTRINPFRLELGALTYYDDQSGGIYFLARENSILSVLVDSLKQILYYKEKPYSLPPHLTITYAKLNKIEKNKVKKKYSHFEGKQFTVNSLYLADTTNKQVNWKLITSFNLSNED